MYVCSVSTPREFNNLEVSSERVWENVFLFFCHLVIVLKWSWTLLRTDFVGNAVHSFSRWMCLCWVSKDHHSDSPVMNWAPVEATYDSWFHLKAWSYLCIRFFFCSKTVNSFQSLKHLFLSSLILKLHSAQEVGELQSIISVSERSPH